jgi:hypothetical protein
MKTGRWRKELLEAPAYRRGRERGGGEGVTQGRKGMRIVEAEGRKTQRRGGMT